MLLTHIHRTTLTVNRMTPCRYLMRSYSSHTPSCMRCAQKNYFSHASRAPPAQDLHSPSRRTESALSRGSRVCAAPTLTPQHREIVLAIICQKLYRLSACGLHISRRSHIHTKTSSLPVPHKFFRDVLAVAVHRTASVVNPWPLHLVLPPSHNRGSH
jgi:hypothetical protein